MGASSSKNSLVDVHRCVYLCWWCCCTNPSGTFRGWNGVGACFSPLEQDRPASTGTPNLRWSIRLKDFKLDFDYSVGFAIRNLVFVLKSVWNWLFSLIARAQQYRFKSLWHLFLFKMISYISNLLCWNNRFHALRLRDWIDSRLHSPNHLKTRCVYVI